MTVTVHPNKLQGDQTCQVVKRFARSFSESIQVLAGDPESLWGSLLAARSAPRLIKGLVPPHRTATATKDKASSGEEQQKREQVPVSQVIRRR